MKPKSHFHIQQGDEVYRPKSKSVEILEVKGLNEDNYLVSEDGGMIRAVLQFEDIDPSKEFYFVFDNYTNTGRGYAILFNN